MIKEKTIQNWLFKHLELFEYGLVGLAKEQTLVNSTGMSWDNLRTRHRIDILAYNKLVDEFYIIEVKKSAAIASAKYQLKYYIKKIQETTEKTCIGIIAAIEFSKPLVKYAEDNSIYLWSIKKEKRGFSKSDQIRYTKRDLCLRSTNLFS